MKQKKPKKDILSDVAYEEPIAEIVWLSSVDIVSTSGIGDGNQGEWDPQRYALYPNY